MKVLLALCIGACVFAQPGQRSRGRSADTRKARRGIGEGVRRYISEIPGPPTRSRERARIWRAPSFARDSRAPYAQRVLGPPLNRFRNARSNLRIFHLLAIEMLQRVQNDILRKALEMPNVLAMSDAEGRAVENYIKTVSENLDRRFLAAERNGCEHGIRSNGRWTAEGWGKSKMGALTEEARPIHINTKTPQIIPAFPPETFPDLLFLSALVLPYHGRGRSRLLFPTYQNQP